MPQIYAFNASWQANHEFFAAVNGRLKAAEE
jgi:hypothetical protein